MYSCGNEDLFSSLQSDASFKDNQYNSQNSSISISEYLQGHAFLNEKKNLEENSTLKNKINGSKEQLFIDTSVCDEHTHLTFPNEFVQEFNYTDVIFGHPYERDFTMEIESKRSQSSSLSRKSYQEKVYNSKSTQSVSKQTKHHHNECLQSYVSSTTGTRENKDLSTEKSNLNPTNLYSNNSLHCIERKEIEVIDLENMDSCDSDYEKKKSFSLSEKNDEQIQIINDEISCTNDIVCTPKLNFTRLSIEEPLEPNASIPAVINSDKAQQIQFNIVEKLIKDTVSFEFDAIRQLLYLQHIALFRHLHKTLEVLDNPNSSNSEFMLRVIEELLQENRLLKNAVFPNHRKT